MDRKYDIAKPGIAAWVRAFVPGLALVLAASCVNDNGETPPPVGNKTMYGSLTISHYETFPPFWERHVEISGRFYDGVSPDPVDWQEQAASGSCRLLKPEAPFCNPGCGSTGLCTVGGICTAYPNPLNAGPVTVTGIKTTAGGTSFVMNPALNVYQPAGIPFSSPPYAEGDLVTVTAPGSVDAPAFSVSGRAHAIPTILNDSIVLDGNAILLRWTPPGANAGPATLTVSIDISHHGGIKGVIVCETEDDGDVEIAGSLVNKLKALGISGYPHVDLVRRSVAPVEDHGLALVLESRILKYLIIPGLNSCRVDEHCPSGQTCQDDYKCQ